MLRALVPVLLAAVLIAAGGASAIHLTMHAAAIETHPHADEARAPDPAHRGDASDCCDAPGGKIGGSCLADAALARLPLRDLDWSRAERAVAAPSSSLQGRPTSVPTGPPKV